MKMELQILDWIQQMRTPVGDVWMVFISRLGNAGMIWILFTCLLLMIPRNTFKESIKRKGCRQKNYD